jgi:hypothetical protein
MADAGDVSDSGVVDVDVDGNGDGDVKVGRISFRKRTMSMSRELSAAALFSWSIPIFPDRDGSTLGVNLIKGIERF